MRRVIAATGAVFALLGPLSVPGARAESDTNRWTFALTPYVWLPNINGTFKYSVPPGAAGSPDVSTGPNNYLQNLQHVLMLAGEARKDRWSIHADAIYLDFADQASSVKAVNFGGPVVGTTFNSSTSSSLRGFLWTLDGAYTFAETPRVTLQVLGGARYLSIRASTDWQLSAAVTGPGAGQVFPASGSISQRADLWDAIVGVRGQVRFGEGHWSIPYYADVGTGSSRITWQALVGVAYAFSWGDAVLAYRTLSYDQSDDKLLRDFRFGGPAIGATLRF